MDSAGRPAAACVMPCMRRITHRQRPAITRSPIRAHSWNSWPRTPCFVLRGLARGGWGYAATNDTNSHEWARQALCLHAVDGAWHERSHRQQPTITRTPIRGHSWNSWLHTPCLSELGLARGAWGYAGAWARALSPRRCRWPRPGSAARPPSPAGRCPGWPQGTSSLASACMAPATAGRGSGGCVTWPSSPSTGRSTGRRCSSSRALPGLRLRARTRQRENGSTGTRENEP